MIIPLKRIRMQLLLCWARIGVTTLVTFKYSETFPLQTATQLVYKQNTPPSWANQMDFSVLPPAYVIA